MRIGLYVSSAHAPPLETLLRSFAAAEEQGFHTAWVGHTFDWDALTLLALAGRVTERIELGSWVVPTYPRHPVAMAQQALTVQIASTGRLVLGIGASHAAVIQKRMGIDYSRPLRHSREYLDVLRELLAGGRAACAGAEFHIAAQLDFGDVPPPPIILAALGPRMLELAGSRADGVAIWLGAARFIESTAIPHIDAGASSAGRPRPRVMVGLPIAVTRNANARAGAERLLALSSKLPAYQRVLEREGVKNASDVAIVGDEEEVENQLETLAALGVSDFNAILFPIEGDPNAAKRTRDALAALARRNA